MSSSSDNSQVANQLPISMDFSRQPDEFYNQITEIYKRIASSVNSRELAFYYESETATFKNYFNANNTQKRKNVYRKVFDLVSLNGVNIPAAGVVAFPHGISNLSKAALIYAGCTSTTPLYFSVMYPNIYLDAVNINFINPLGTALTSVYAVAEYLKE